jgi:hypothetical protein
MRRILVGSLLAFGIAAFGAGTASAACIRPYCAVPVATTGAASAITSTTATLNGAISANGSGPTTYQFQLGTSPAALGAVASGNGPDGYGMTAVSFGMTALTPSTTYFYRIIVSNDGGLRLGQIVSFTTDAAPVPPPPPPDNGGGTGPGGTTPGGGEASTNAAVDPDGVTIRVRPRDEPDKPYRYTVSGRVDTDDSTRCDGGEVSIRVAGGGEEITRRAATLESDCSYSLRVTVPSADLKRRGGKLNIRSVFTGTERLNAMSSSTVKVSYG